MIRNSVNGLRVLHELLILARRRAAEAGAVELAKLLDDIEYLPALMLDSEDKTQVFRDYATMIAERQQWARIVDILDSGK